VAAVVVALFVVFQWTSPAPAPREPSGPSPSPSSGPATIQERDLPPEARHTLELIDAGGPFPYEQDGVVFHNFEGQLPSRPDGYYHEYTVETPGADDRGARRIVTGGSSEYYWTDDHYQSFERIER
jgi:ribonuclease T1